MMKVKICGIRRKKDAIMAAYLGADAVGVLIGRKHPSPDFVDIETAIGIIDALPPFCAAVIVTHLTDTGEILEIIDAVRSVGVNTLQLHGDNTPDDITTIRNAVPRLKIIKAINVVDERSIDEAGKYVDLVDALALDTLNKATGQVGGSGKTHDWSISAEIVGRYDKPVILAGGLNPDNVEEAIKTVKPYAVDVNSGVKGNEGFKDEVKMRSFIELAKGFG